MGALVSSVVDVYQGLPMQGRRSMAGTDRDVPGGVDGRLGGMQVAKTNF